MLKLILFVVVFPIIILIGYIVWKYIFEILRTLILTDKLIFPNLSVIRNENDSFDLFIESLLFILPGFNVVFIGIILIMDILELVIYSVAKLWTWIQERN